MNALKDQGREASAYSAFISYSRTDGAFASWLHRKLESFRFPAYDGRALIRAGAKDRKHPLRPAFRDIDELAASGDLGDSIRKALEASNAMVLICSPAAARSHWVNQEVEHFIRRGRGARILPVVISGTPDFARGDAAANAAFPPALGELPADPLWVDARPGAESRERVFARIAAGLLDVSFDQIWKRKQRADRARAFILSAAAVIVAAPLAYAGYELARPVAMSECPIDSIRFVNAWTGDTFETNRVGARLVYSCPEGIVTPEQYVEADHLTFETMCRGPYGETVFDGEIIQQTDINKFSKTQARWVYNTIGGAPCCFWTAPVEDEVDEIIADDGFRWYSAADAPTLSSLRLPIASVDFGGDAIVDTDPGLEGHTFAASVCRRDIVRDFQARLKSLGARASNIISPKPGFDDEAE